MNFLALDYSDESIFNGAIIRYPGQIPDLLSDFIGGPNMSFLLRVNTLDDDTPTTNNEAVTYNVYRGLASEFPNTSNWALLNASPVLELDLIDSDRTDIDPDVFYRYAVETIYTNGESEVTFSNEIIGGLLSVTDYQYLTSDVQIYPNPADEFINIKLGNNAQTNKPIEIFDALGKQVLSIDASMIQNGLITKNINALQSGLYFVKVHIDNTIVTKKMIVK